MSKEDIRYMLENHFPWFNEDFAEVLVKKLTEKDLRKLREECEEGRKAEEHRFCKHLLAMKTTERNAYIQRIAMATPIEEKENGS